MVQAGFQVLRQLLLQLELGFNIRALEAFITLEIIKAVAVKAIVGTVAE